MGDEKRYYWLKLKDDFFKSRKMKKLRKVAGGDTYTIIYLKLQLLSINNEGVVEFEGTDKDIFEQLALDIDEEVDDIKMTVAFCQANDLIEFKEEDLFLTEVPELIGSETQAARRMRKKRAKDNKAIEGTTGENIVQTERNNVTGERNNVQDCYTEIEIDIERRDRDKSSSGGGATLPSRDGDYDLIVERWNNLDVNVPKVKGVNVGTKRYQLLSARINEFGIDGVLAAVDEVARSRFLLGYKSDFVISFDWFIKPNNFIKVLEGNYRDKEPAGDNAGKSFAQRAREERISRMLGDRDEA